MADIKRDFLYEFNRMLRDVYSTSPSIVSVFESIDNGALKLSPFNLTDEGYVENVGKLIHMVKRIVADPYKSFQGKQEIVPISKAQSVDKESIKLTLSDPDAWSIIDGKRTPKQAYTLIKDYVFINYENAFISQLISQVILSLKKIKARVTYEHIDDFSEKYKQFIGTIDSYTRKLMRLFNERVFADNRRREVDMSCIFVTDILRSDTRYHFCYRFFCEYLKNNGTKSTVVKDFRVLYHNFALVKILYSLTKHGYVISDSEYYISTSGKIFIDTLYANNGNKEVVISQTKKGISLSYEDKCIVVDFSKVMLHSNDGILSDYRLKASKVDEKRNYYVAYLSSSTHLTGGALGIGYKNVEKAINELIDSL